MNQIQIQTLHGWAETVEAVAPKERRLWEDLRTVLQYLEGGCKNIGYRLFSRVCCDRTRGNPFKLKERFRLDIRKKFVYY